MIRNIAAPEVTRWDHSWSYLTQADWETLKAFREANIARLAEAPRLLPRAARNRELYAAALSPEATEGLKSYSALIPPDDELEQPEEFGNLGSDLRQQAQLTILAFKARVAVSADLWLGGFDTHAITILSRTGC